MTKFVAGLLSGEMTAVSDHHFPKRWVLLTLAGWGLGIPLLLLLSVLAESLGFQGFNMPVGLAMGMTVGACQARVLRKTGIGGRGWLAATMLGLSMPFCVVDASRALDLALPYSLHVAVLCGGALAGVAQSVVMGWSLRRALGWMSASVLAWGLAAGAVAFADAFVRDAGVRGILGMLLYLSLVACGGLLLGAVSGVALAYGGAMSGPMRSEKSRP